MELAEEKVVVLDGAMGSSLIALDLGPDDYHGHCGCHEILIETRPDVVRQVHASYLEAGCDVIETNTFGANAVTLAEYGLAGRTEALNRAAAALAREVADGYSGPGRPRYVLGSVGPGSRLPSLGNITFDELREAYVPQVRGLLAGGAEALCIETCQDLLQTKAALLAAWDAMAQVGKKLPLFASVTVEATGTMLVGSDVSTAAASLWPMGVDVIGLNCATGPSEMKRHVEQLSACGPRFIMAMPNAGLPRNEGGRMVYPMTPVAFSEWVERFVKEDGVGIVGGCCGTTAAHIAELVRRVGSLPAPKREVRFRAEVSSLFQAVSMKQIPAPLLVGERTNANGSKEFRSCLLKDDLDGMLSVAKEQEKGGAHSLDVSVAYAGRNEKEDMTRFLARLVRTNRLPVVIDSTAPEVIEAALKTCGGRCTINSINLEEGEGRFDRVSSLARRYGAAVIALAIDEQGMAMSCERKIAVAQRMLKRCVEVHGLAPSDLIFDMLTFTVGSGEASTRGAARETLEAIARFKSAYPEALTILGVSNVSFGLSPPARRVLNSVFLSLAVERGLDQAIVNARGIVPLHRIEEGTRQAAVRLLLDDRREGDPLQAYLKLFESAEGEAAKSPDEGAERLEPGPALRRLVIEGDTRGLEGTLEALLAAGMPAVEVVNTLLVPAMKEVGELFGAGLMQLPFVLQSAEVMRSAVARLKPHMGSASAAGGGCIVLATVKGDVHDIGKNLVEIILSNNGYRVVDLGIRVEVEAMLKAAGEHKAEAIGMSGLLVKSTVAMKENLEEMKRRGVSIPVLLGGAALNRRFVEEELIPLYGPNVHYCADAFDGLKAMEKIARGSREAAEATSISRPITSPSRLAARPRFGVRVLPELPLPEVLALINEGALFKGQWRYRKGRMSDSRYRDLIDREVRPAFEALKERAQREGFLAPKAVYGWFRAWSEGETVRLLAEDGRIAAEFRFPRQGRGRQDAPTARSELRSSLAPPPCGEACPDSVSLADFVLPRGDPNGPDVVGLFVVTVGPGAAAAIGQARKEGMLKEHLHLHGLAAQSAEACAEWMHRRMQEELGIGRRGRRCSFGYPACPNLDDQAILFELLRPEAIGVTLTEQMQMVPEFSVSALVLRNTVAG
jgi:5-methyltetrahydrofolate--homocysteine methyltransferase